MNLRDTAERLVWTVIAAAGGGLIAGPVLGVTTWQAAGTAALTAAVNFVTIAARKRLTVLPDPGQGLPALPTNEGGQSVVWVVLGVLFLVSLLFVATGIVDVHIR